MCLGFCGFVIWVALGLLGCYLVTWYTVVSAGLFGGGFRYLAACWVSDLGVVADLRLGSVVVV